ncbi:MAG: hypothetical protein IBJ11_05085 [Phycisphaerales bacterium]|nr:hypothetical protein [Phycisphaerales bacterium]
MTLIARLKSVLTLATTAAAVALGVVGTVGVGLVWAPPAMAQGMFGNAGMWSPPVNAKEIERLAEMLKLTGEQQASVKGVFDGMLAQHQKAADDLRKVLEEVQKEFQESQDGSVWRDMTKKFVEFGRFNEDLTKRFQDDVKLVLTDEQAQNWPKFERYLRRARGLVSPGGMQFVSGSAVDVIQLLDDQKVDEKTRAEIAPAVEQYETEMDRLLVERKKLEERQTKAQMEVLEKGGNFMENMGRWEEMFIESRDLMVKIRDLNSRVVRQVSSQLAEETRAKLDKAWNERSLPQVYGPSPVTNGFDQVAKFDDLTDDQKKQLDDLKAGYASQAKALNEKWAAAAREHEVAIKMQDMMMGGGGNESVREARKARRDLDRATYAKLREMLSPSQKEKLPERPNWRETGFQAQ